VRNSRKTDSSSFQLSAIAHTGTMFRRAAALALATAFAFSLPIWADDSGDTKARIRHIRELGRGDSQSITALAGFLKDPTVEVRVEAVKAIAGIGTQYSLEPLARATHDDDSEIQIMATDGLVNFYLPGYAAKGLGGSFTRTTRLVRGFFNIRNDQVVDAGIQIRDDVGQALGDLVGLEVDTLEARANAALAAGILRARLAVPGLETALRARDTDLIFEALVALQKIRDPSAGPAAAALAQDPDDKIQTLALETLGVLRSVTSGANVRQALDRARSAKVRRAALEALAMIATAQDRAILLRYSADRDPQLRAAAIEGLGRLRDPEDMATVEETFNEQNLDERVRLAAAFAVVMEGKVETSEFSALRYLVNSLNLKSHTGITQAYLAELLRRREVRQAVQPLIEEPTCTKDEKILTAQSLAESGAPDALPVIERLAKDTNPDVSFAATRSLRLLRSQLPIH
jgi:HEAT repeat protein